MADLKTPDQKLVENFLNDFSGKLSATYGQDIDFILLFGSAAREEWKKGVSDVDMVIQVKYGGKIKEISEFAQKIFWELDGKYNTKFNDVCSVKGKDAVDAALKSAMLYVPFEVFGPGDIDWERAIIKKPELALGAQIIASQGTLFKKMKVEGKILFGRDIRQIITLKTNMWEKAKALLIPFYLSFFSIILSFFFPKKALRIAQKSALYAGESVLFFLDLPLGKSTKSVIDELEKDLKNQVKSRHNILNLWEVDILFGMDWIKLTDFNFIKKALKIKYDWENVSKKFDYLGTVGFCMRAFLFVLRMNWYAISHMKNKNNPRFPAGK